MKNVFKLANGKWRFEIVENGKRYRKSFSSKTDAVDYAKNWFDARKFELSFFLNLPKERIKDIKDAIAILPKGLSLCEAVRKVSENASFDISISDAFDAYKKAIIKRRGSADFLRISSFFEKFPHWPDSNSVLEWILDRGMPKTVREHYSQLKAFFSFAVRRGFIKTSPLESINPSTDLPKIQRAKIQIWNLTDLKLFFEFLKENRPQWINWFCVACFTGIRHAEINRLKPEHFDIEHKRIIMPYDITKTGDSWILEGLDNIWACLDKYGYDIEPITDSATRRLHEAFAKWYFARTKKFFSWENNICRHSFCTYHLSLYRNPVKTAMLLKHRNPDTMWQHYLAGLVKKELAQEYFQIVP